MPRPPTCLDRSTVKTAAGVMTYLIEELGDARLRAQQLQGYITAAMELVDHSEKRDHFYEVAGHLLTGIPDAMFKLDKALNAVALAASKMDYDDLKQALRPEKVEELEAVAEQNRLRYDQRRSSEGTMIDVKTAVQLLNQLASETEAQGVIPKSKLAALIAGLEEPRSRVAATTASGLFRRMATYLGSANKPSRLQLVSDLRRVYAEAMVSQEEIQAGAGEQFQKENPKITDEEVAEINRQHEKNKDVVKDKAAGLGVDVEDALNDMEKDMITIGKAMDMVVKRMDHARSDMLDERNAHFKDKAQDLSAAVNALASAHDKASKALDAVLQLASKGDPEFWDKEGAAGDPYWFTAKSPGTDSKGKPFKKGDRVFFYPRTKTTLTGPEAEKASREFDMARADEGGFGMAARFQTGKPADPTKHMSPEDAATWGEMHDKYKDVVKDKHAASADVQAIGVALARRGIEASYSNRRGPGFWIKDRGWVDLKTASDLAQVGDAVQPVVSGQMAWGRG